MEVYQGETDMDARLTQTAALAAINRHIPKDACVIGPAGSLPGCMQRMWRAHTRDTYNMEYGYSCMGYEISGALGVKLAAGDREVYSMVGDGSFIMLHSELLTAVQEQKRSTAACLIMPATAASTICRTVRATRRCVRSGGSAIRKRAGTMENSCRWISRRSRGHTAARRIRCAR